MVQGHWGASSPLAFRKAAMMSHCWREGRDCLICVNMASFFKVRLAGWRSTIQVAIVEELAPEDAYDLVLVIMRKNNALDILPILAANTETPSILFLMNSAAGPQQLVDALGPDRVLIGFPMSSGYREGHVIHCLAGNPETPFTVPFGEPDGRITRRTVCVSRIVDSAVGYRSEIRTDMDAWLKTHVALLFPSIAPALYGCGTDHLRLARTRDAVLLAVRAIREGFRVLEALQVPIVPAKMRLLSMLPEPVLLPLAQRMLATESMEVALVKHANSARDEAKHLVDEFLELARRTTVPTPAIDRLYPHLDPDTPLFADGSAQIPVDWRRFIIATTGAAMLAAAMAALLGGKPKERSG